MVVQKNTQAIEALPVGTEPPRIGRALTVGFKTIRQDPMGVLLVTLGFILILGLISLVPYNIVIFNQGQLGDVTTWLAPLVLFFSSWAMLTLYIGYIGWADARRFGQRPGLGYIFDITRKTIRNSIQWSFSYLIIDIFLWWITYTILVFSPQRSLPPETGGIWEVFGILLSFVQPVSYLPLALARPFLFIVAGLSGWAIAKGAEFNASVIWALKRISPNIIYWYLAGLILSSCEAIGGLAFIIGPVHSAICVHCCLRTSFTRASGDRITPCGCFIKPPNKNQLDKFM